LVAVTVGNQTTEFGYDGVSRPVYIRRLENGSQVSLRYFVWCGNRMCEERDASGTNIAKRFYPQGVVLETGTNAGAYYYTRDHLGSVHELTDAAGNLRARYSYDPFGRRTKVSGDLNVDFGFAGMFWASEASLAFARFRAYDPELGRWLSRDPLAGAEFKEGPNLYAYVGNGPIVRRDPSGLCDNTVDCTCLRQPGTCAMAGLSAGGGAGAATAAVGAAGAGGAAAATGSATTIACVESAGLTVGELTGVTLELEPVALEIAAESTLGDQLLALEEAVQALDPLDVQIFLGEGEYAFAAGEMTEAMTAAEAQFAQSALDYSVATGTSYAQAARVLAQLVKWPLPLPF
jgi:RHS repeat-associated protein